MSTEENTYIVQVFSSFAPLELSPLLVRLEKDATVGDCIQASLNKYLQRQPVMVLPSDLATEYFLCSAGGDGYPKVGAFPFDREATLRTISSLEFPFMISLVFCSTANTNQNDNNSTAPQDVSVSQSTTAGDGGLKKTQHKTLSALEKQALAKEFKERERIREENLRAIERRRIEKEREAYQHCESYEVIRREKLLKEERDRENAELERELKEQEDQMRQEAAAEAAAAAKKEKSLLELHRKEMEEAVNEERRRIQEVQQAREEKIERQRIEREQFKQERAKQLAAEKSQRINAAYNSLIDDLHSKLHQNYSADNERLQREQYARKDVERMEADLRGIASLEEKNFIPKIAERRFRVESALSAAEYEQSKINLTETSISSTVREEEARFEQWMLEEAKRKEALVSQLELEYRAREQQKLLK